MTVSATAISIFIEDDQYYLWNVNFIGGETIKISEEYGSANAAF